jgi:SAM-dependent methyltransferase
MSSEYTVLAPFYNKIGLASYAEAITPRLLDYAQRNDWMGRRILDLGCGTGGSLLWFGKHTYSTYGVDQSPEMLAIAKSTLTSNSITSQLYEQDIRKLDLRDTVDLALAIRVINELENLRDLEAVFKSVHAVLHAGKFFIFDLQTLEGLAAMGQTGDQIFYDQDGLTVIISQRYDYERQALTRRYLIFQHDGGAWRRLETEQVLRGYPTQAVGALLQRSGYQLHAILNPNFTVYDPASSGIERVYFAARKV